MTFPRYASVLGVLILTCGLVAQAGQDVAAPRGVSLTPEQIEEFLLHARITRMRSAGDGVTNSRRATLTEGALTHDAHVQVIDQAMPLFEAGRASEVNFKDTYRFNIAGYELARLLDLNVPVSVPRTVEGKSAAVTWWVDDVLVDEETRVKQRLQPPDMVRFSKQIQVLRIFDELIQNRDRNQGNLLWTSDWTLWMIDHTRAFRLGRELLKPDQIQRCPRPLLEKLRALRAETVSAAVGRTLMPIELEALLIRRDVIVQRIESLIAERGEDAVLFDDPL